MAQTRRRKRRTAKRKVVRAVAKTRRVYRRARNSKAGQRIVPLVKNAAVDSVFVLGGKVAPRIAGDMLKLDRDGIPAAGLSLAVGVGGAMLLDQVGNGTHARMFAAGAFAAALETFLPRLPVIGDAVGGYLGDPYYARGALSADELAEWHARNELAELSGHLAPGQSLHAGPYYGAAEVYNDPGFSDGWAW